MNEVWRKRDYYNKRGVPTEVLDPQTLYRLEPNLRGGMAVGLLVSQDGVLYPPCAARVLMERAEERGARLRRENPVAQIGHGRMLMAGGLEISAVFIVNAAGAYAAELTPGIDIQKGKGPPVITHPYPTFFRHPPPQL